VQLFARRSIAVTSAAVLRNRRSVRSKPPITRRALLVLQTGTRLSRDDVHFYVKRTVDVFVQLSRTGGRRYVSQAVLNDLHEDG